VHVPYTPVLVQERFRQHGSTFDFGGEHVDDDVPAKELTDSLRFNNLRTARGRVRFNNLRVILLLKCSAHRRVSLVRNFN